MGQGMWRRRGLEPGEGFVERENKASLYHFPALSTYGCVPSDCICGRLAGDKAHGPGSLVKALLSEGYPVGPAQNRSHFTNR